jgi:hypothetical protein
MKYTVLLFSFLFFSIGAFAQSEVLTNREVIEMSQAGLGEQIIIKKIQDTRTNFDVSANALIELKKAGVHDDVIALILEKGKAGIEIVKPQSPAPTVPVALEENQTRNETQKTSFIPSPREALLSARTIAIEKSSLNPSRQALEKALFKRREWSKYNLTIVRYKETADLYIEIGRIPFTWITHRYVFRIYDRRNGAVLTAGETTSYGSLAENLAREITQKLDSIRGN